MEIYDTANKLSEEIKNSTQYINLKNAQKELFNDEEKKKKIEEFEKLREEVQLIEIKQQNNQEIDEEDKKVKMAKLYNVLVENKDIKEYFDAQIAFNKLIIDVNKIIGDGIKEVIE